MNKYRNLNSEYIALAFTPGKGLHFLDWDEKNTIFTRPGLRESMAATTAFFILDLQMLKNAGKIQEVKTKISLPDGGKLNEDTIESVINRCKSGILTLGFNDPNEFLQQLKPEHDELYRQILSSEDISPEYKEKFLGTSSIKERR